MAALTVQLLLQYPSIFSANFFLPNIHWLPIFVTVSILSSGLTMAAGQKTTWRAWQNSEFANRIQRNLPGLLLAAALTLSTFVLATAFNHPGINNVDNYFDTDSGD